jgi:hypothetical protein
VKQQRLAYILDTLQGSKFAKAWLKMKCNVNSDEDKAT